MCPLSLLSISDGARAVHPPANSILAIKKIEIRK
jgi:hypothetical protein